MAERGSSRKENETEKLPALNHSITGTTTDLPLMFMKIQTAIAKEASIVPLAKKPTICFGSLLFKRPISTNPIRGKSGINAAMLKFIAYTYPLNLFNTSISVDLVFRYITIRIANPTAISAAATAMVKNVNTWPAVSL